MRVRELERMLIANGVGAAKIDAITRRLRQAGRLPKGGRGTNAPEVGASEAAAILIALAGSAKGAEADMRLAKLAPLACIADGSDGKTLLEAVSQLLEQPKHLGGLRELRVARTRRQATFVFSDGRLKEFHSERREQPATNNFYVEGVLPAQLVATVANALKAPVACSPT